MNRLDARIKRRWPWMEGLDVYPLAVLFGLNLVDEFDRAAFALLTPNIRDAFDLSNTGIGVIVGATVAVVLAGALPIGFVGDRIRRVRLVFISAALWGSMALLTGVAPTVLALALFRLGSGLGRITNDPVHTSLLSDYYPEPVHGRIFAFHRAANPFGNMLGPLLGGIAAFYGTRWWGRDDGWRLAFVVTAIPTVFAAIAARRLREPIRGESQNADLAAEAAKEDPIPFGRAWRWLFTVPTLRRLYVTGFVFGAGVFSVSPFLNLFFEDVFHINEVGRALIAAADALFFMLGTFFGGAAADRLRRDSFARVAAFAGLGIAIFGGGLFLAAISPNWRIAVIMTFIAWFGIGMVIAPNLAIQALAIPARIRSTGFGVGTLFLGLGGIVFNPIAGSIADNQGVRQALATLTPLTIIAGILYVTAGRFVDRDIARGLQTLATEVQLRRERLDAGGRSLLVCRGVDVHYDGVQVLFGVDFEVGEGELVALLGTNGAGKSTLLKAIAGVVHPSGGGVFFGGRNIGYLESAETAAAGISLVPGGRGVFPSLTVSENLTIAGWLFKRDPDHIARATEEVLGYFPVLRERWNERAGSLSGGEQQMLTLAQAFVSKPSLLMIDELSLGLAPILVERLLDIVRAIHVNGTTVILVEQSVNIALTIAKRAYFMEKGEIRFSGPTEELLQRPDILRSVFLEGAAAAIGQTDGNGARTAPAKVTSRTKKPAAVPFGPPVLEVNNLVKRFGGITAVDGVSFTLRDGQVLGLIGPNGAGKTTIFDLISGFLTPDRGSIVLAGRDITGLSPHLRARAGLGRSFQDARLFPSMTVAENIALAFDRHVDVRDPVVAAIGHPDVLASEEQVTARVEELIDLMGLDAFRDKFVSELSTGSRRIVDVACALAHDPTVLILDEPSSGIAQRETEALGPLLLRVKESSGCSLLVIEHDIPLITSISDEILALDLGQVVAQDTPQRIVVHPGVVASYLGTSHDVILRSGARKQRRAPANGNGRKKATVRTKRKT
jgi:branched-chain amino acid transport system ATP-binding protein